MGAGAGACVLDSAAKGKVILSDYADDTEKRKAYYHENLLVT